MIKPTSEHSKLCLRCRWPRENSCIGMKQLHSLLKHTVSLNTNVYGSNQSKAKEVKKNHNLTDTTLFKMFSLKLKGLKIKCILISAFKRHFHSFLII